MKCENGICCVGDRPYLCVRDLGLRYGPRQTLGNVNLDVSACSITALIGPSGSGKSSLLNCFNRLTDHIPRCKVEGRIEIDGEDILAASVDVRALRRKVGMVFQKPNPFPLSIWQNLALTLKQHGIKDKIQVAAKVEAVLRGVALWDEVKDRLHASALALSGGQQQRLCIARALILDPDLVLLDEPCSALDPLSSAAVEELIRDMRRRLTVILVTHNLAQARRLADATALFWAHEGIGSIVEQGPTERLFAAPQHRLTAAYVSGAIG